jgi:hypothetical protein
MNWKIGDRVRMIHSTEMVGTIAGPVKPNAGKDGTDRIPIKWDRSGATSEWNPGFLRPIDSREADDPDELTIGGAVARRDKVTIDANGVTLIRPGGFFAA